MIRSSFALLVVAVGGVAVGCKSEPPPRVAPPPVGTYGAPRYDPAKPLPGQIPQQIPQQYPQQQQMPAAQPAPGSYVTPAPGEYQSAYVPTPMPAQNPFPGTESMKNAGGYRLSAPGYDPRIAAPPSGQIYQPPPPAPGSYNDVPIVRDHPPEQRAFVDAYNRVGRPKMAIYLNRNLTGQIIEAGDGVTAATPLPAAGGQQYIKPGSADEAWAKNLDYEAVENILTDWFAAGGQTEVISPTLSRARLTSEQQQTLDRGERLTLSDITQRLDADVFIQVQARPTRQTAGGLSVRLVGEAINTRGGRSIGRAVVDVPPPLEKTTINEYTRFLARKMMDDMIASWSYAPPQGATPTAAPMSAPAAPVQTPAMSPTPAPMPPAPPAQPAPPVQTPAATPSASAPVPTPVAPPPPGSILPPSSVLPPR